MARTNASGEKEMVKHQKTVRGARKALTKESSKLTSNIRKDINHALKQDEAIQRDMKKSDKKKKR